MSNEENSSQNSKDCIAEAIQFLMNKQIFAWLLQYLVPEYHNLPIDLIAKQISCIKEYKNRWYDLICEMPIRGKKGVLVLFIAGSKAENDRNTDDFDEEEYPFDNDEDSEHTPQIIHMVALQTKADDSEIGHDAFYVLVETLLNKRSEEPEQQFGESCVFNFAEIKFNQSKKLNGVHRILQIVFSDDTNKEELLNTEFDIPKRSGI